MNSQLALLVPLFLAVLSFDELTAQSSPTDPQWEKEISKLEEKFRSHPEKAGGILFVGSSSIRLWKLDDSFPEVVTVNHGFGGSQLSDVIHYFDRIVVPVRPRAIVLYAGDNDIAKGKSPETVVSDFRRFHQKSLEAFPQTPVYFISIKPSLKRWNLKEPMQTANRQVAAFCETTKTARYIDIWPGMLLKDDTPDPRLFAEDGLHLNATGYAGWTKVLRNRLEEDHLVSPSSTGKP